MIDRLIEIITIQNINDSIAYYNFKQPGGDAGNIINTKGVYWYKKSYPIIISIFETTRNNFEISFIKRVGCVYSWIGNANTCNFNQQNITEINNLENIFLNLGDLGNQAIVDEPQINSYVLHCSQLINNTNNNRIPTISKFLHFSCPQFFPIMDKNVAFALQTEINQESYLRYINAVREFLQMNNENVNHVNIIAHANQLSPLRIIDIVLFQYFINQ